MKKTVTALMCVFVMLCGTISSAAQDAGGYKETSYPLAKSAHERHGQHMPGVFTRSDGGVDYFVFPEEDQGMNPQQFHSGDGGKTWQEVSMDWYQQAKRQYKSAVKGKPETPGGLYDGGGTGKIGSVYMASNGEIYCTMNIGTRDVKHGNSTGGEPVIKVLRVVDGVPAEIPGLTLGAAVETGGGEWEIPQYKIAGLDGKGGVAIAADAYSSELNAYTSTILTYDLATGKLKSKAASPVPKAQFYTYVNGTAYAVNFLTDNGKWELAAYDGAAGKLLRKLPYPAPAMKSDEMQAVSVAAGDDGTVYATSTGGLYRLDPDSSQFVKLLDGAASRLKTDAKCNYRAACTVDGKVYNIICYVTYGTSKMDENSKTQGKLYCYSPR